LATIFRVVTSNSGQPALKRSLSLSLLVLYGIGTTVGAGIYALMGEVAGRAGVYTPVSFLVASALAASTALAFAELGARYPSSAGEAIYVREGFRSQSLSVLVGLLVVVAGSVSAAAIANGFVGYIGEVLLLPRAVSILALVVLLGAVASWGINESVTVASIITGIELVGLALVIGFGWGDALASPRMSELIPPPDAGIWLSIFGGAILAFYAFLGFEDMVNVAEEVRDVRRTLPMAIIITLLVTSVLFVLTALVCVLVVSPEELSESGAPLVLVYDRSGGVAPSLLRVIGVVAMVNGALIQIIMASRVLYGLSEQGSLPALLGRVHPRTQTPLIATIAVTVLVGVMAVGFRLGPLAEVTSVVTLVVFGLVNLALFVIKGRDPRPSGVMLIPRPVPLVGFAVSVGFLAFEVARLFGT
jgi:amino acid transporter